MKKITIAIDGYSSTGKSTLAKELAKHLGYAFVDTGAMYRAVTLFALENKFIQNDFFDKEGLIQSLPNITLEFKFSEELGYAAIYLNGENVEKKIRNIEVSSYVSQVATVSKVRSRLVEQQQEMGKNKGIVMDGRDIGTVVFPNAELKIFMTASPQTRAQRRYDELQSKGDPVAFEEVLKNIQDRDFIDTTRLDSPLKKATDAIEIDNSNLSRKEQFNIVLEIVQEHL